MQVQRHFSARRVAHDAIPWGIGPLLGFYRSRLSKRVGGGGKAASVFLASATAFWFENGIAADTQGGARHRTSGKGVGEDLRG